MPDLNLYYIASQLSQLFHVDKTDNERFTILLCPHWAQHTADPISVIAVGSRGTQSAGRHTLLYHYRRVWDIAMDKLEITPLNDYTPLWHNKNLHELSQIPNPEIWSARGIYYLHHLMSDGEPKTFRTLQEEFTRPNNMFFRYLQI